MPLLTDIETHLGTVGPFVGGSTTFTVRRNFIPDTPDAVIALIEFPAGPAERAMGASIGAPVRERAGLQVTTRSDQGNYDDARTVAEAVHQELDFLAATLSGRRYFVQAMHPPALKEQDRNKRWLLEANYVVFKERG